MATERSCHTGKWIRLKKSCQISYFLMLRIAERQYDWTSKGHLNVTPYGIVLDFPHSDKEKRGSASEEV